MSNKVSRKEAILHDRRIDLIVNFSDYLIDELNMSEKSAEIISEIVVDNKDFVLSRLNKKRNQ